MDTEKATDLNHIHDLVKRLSPQNQQLILKQIEGCLQQQKNPATQPDTGGISG